jgi:hypothetical protein
MVVNCKRFSKHHRTTEAQVIAELNILLEDSVSTKTLLLELHKSTIHGRAASDY